MADDGDDLANLEEERANIRQLQSDIAWKKESLERQRQKKQALNEELNTRTHELEQLQEKYRLEQHRGGKALESKNSEQREEAINDFMKEEVIDLLKKRVPVMTERTGGLGGHTDRGGAGADEAAGATEGKKHDIVLVSYISANDDGKLDDFKASFRINNTITVADLHEEACAYWGCSPKTFILCRVTDSTPENLMLEKANSTLQGNPNRGIAPVLMLQEEAHLHLIRREALEKFKQARKKMMEEEAKKRAAEPAQKDAAAEEGDAAPKGTLKTMKAVETGTIAAERQDEAFVEALKPWPGIYTLLKRRGPIHDRRAKIIKFRDIVIFGFLGILSMICIACRNSVSEYYLRQGAYENLVYGKSKETSNSVVQNFLGIRRPEEVWDWMGGSFHYQIFNENSSLREFYTPMGVMRLRQQKAGEKKCDREDLPYYVQQTCYHIHVNAETQDKSDLVYKEGYFVNVSQTGFGRLHWPDPTLWSAATDHVEELEGSMQAGYDASGYKVDYTLDADNISDAGDTFLYDIVKYKDLWVTPQTRMLALDVVMANYHLHGHVAASFLIEISPSGAVYTSLVMYPFNLQPTYWDGIGQGLDWLRGLIIYLYIMLIRVYYETKRKVVRQKKGLTYVFSFFGFIDQSIVAMFTALMFMRAKADPPAPWESDNYFPYVQEGRNAKHLFVLEASLFGLIMMRFATLSRIFSSVFKIWKMFYKSFLMFLHFLAVVFPVLAGIVFLASAIWDPYLERFSSWTETFVTIIGSIRHGLPVEVMYLKDKWWTVPFTIYFFFALSAFFINMFLAITVHAFFEVELMEGSKDDGWSKEQWQDWMLYPKVFTLLTGEEPGACQRDEESSEGGSSSDEGEDDDE